MVSMRALLGAVLIVGCAGPCAAQSDPVADFYRGKTINMFIGVGVGAMYPKFEFDNAAEIPTSFGGAVCMMVSIAFVGVMVMIEAWPIYQLTLASLRPGRVMAPTFWVVAPSLAIITALTAAAVVFSLQLGIRRLEQLRE